MKTLRLASLLFVWTSTAYTPPLNRGIEVRVCQDKDCLLDGSKETLALVRSLVPDDDDRVTVAPCGCLGPCGSGPTVDLRVDGIRVKDAREGRDGYFLFKEIDSARAATDMLALAGVEAVDHACDADARVTSTRKLTDIDRNGRIGLQRVLYAMTALPLLNAHLTGTWDEMGGTVVPGSYYAAAVAVFN